MRSERKFGRRLTHPAWAVPVAAALLLSALCADALRAGRDAADRPPNFVVILVDDLGYADLGCFGAAPGYVKTPHIDRMARRGVRLTDFYAAPVCTPARAMLMTGSYAKRVGLATGSRHPGVLLSGDAKGLNPSEVTIAELLRRAGYATACIGKWHLGDQSPFWPTEQGFDEFFGLPYSNDIYPPTRPDKWDFPPLPVLENETVVEVDPNQDLLTRRFTERAVRFIERRRDEPFFLYLPHPMPHRPVHASERFKQRFPEEKLAGIKRGDKSSSDFLYPAAVEELDWSVGRILEALRSAGIEDNTLVIFTSDNGPNVGKTGPLRGTKSTVLEGGVRVPFVAQWPGTIPAGSASDAVATVMDLLPTLAALAGASPPEDRTIDGHDIRPVLRRPSETDSPYKILLYYQRDRLRAVRAGPWKLHLGGGGDRLYHLENDPAERHNVAEEHPKLVERLKRRARKRDRRIEANRRPAGRVEQPEPIVGHDGRVNPPFEDATGRNETPSD